MTAGTVIMSLLAVTFQLLLLVGGGQAADTTITGNCKLSREIPKERDALKLLEPLTNKVFSVDEKSEDGKTYTYEFQVCGDVGDMKGVGLVQKEGKNKVIIGSYNSTQAIHGSDWVMLIYGDGDKYDTHCTGEKRRAIIMISCDRNTAASNLQVVLENRERDKDCFYLFELDTSAVCPALPPSKLSVGSILILTGVCCFAVYLIGGFLYMRLVVGAKGVEQFPHYAFWSEIGNLSADGCDFVCRSRGNRREPHTHTAVATEPLEEEPEERDDHLLPM